MACSAPRCQVPCTPAPNSATFDAPGRASAVTPSAPAAAVRIAVTTSRTPILDGELVKPGMHVSAFGADEPGKVELATSLVKSAKLVVDDRALALTDGAINVAALSGAVDAGAIHAELGEVLAGRKPGRAGDDEVTIFGAVGLAWQDLVAAELCYRQAVAANGGVWIEL